MSTPRHAMSDASLLDTVRELEPAIRDHLDEAERERRLPAAAAHLMRDDGLYRICRPKAFGRYEADPMTAFQVFEDVSRIDSPAGRNLQLSCGVDGFGAWYRTRARRRLSPRQTRCSLVRFFRARRAVPVDGGYRVTGRTPFNRGVNHCSSRIGLANIVDNDALRMSDSGGPVTLITACPIGNATIVETWGTLGMRGTGTHDAVMTDVFVPRRHTAWLAPLDKPGSAHGGPLYRYTVWAVIAALLTVATGIARAAIDDLIQLAGTKSPAYTAKPLKARGTVQMKIGRAKGALDAARAYLRQSLLGI